MGAWGCGSFENDDAVDWVYEFESSGVAAVASALEHVSSIAEDEYLEAPEASAAIAAAEIVAAAQDGDLSKLSETAREAFDRHREPLIASHLSEFARHSGPGTGNLLMGYGAFERRQQTRMVTFDILDVSAAPMWAASPNISSRFDLIRRGVADGRASVLLLHTVSKRHSGGPGRVARARVQGCLSRHGQRDRLST